MNTEEAGFTLDVLIAEKVMGLRVVPDHIASRGVSVGEAGPQGSELLNYSADISAAWKVVEHLRSRGFDFDSFSSSTKSGGGWSDVVFMTRTDEFMDRAETFQLAICRAALKAVSP